MTLLYIDHNGLKVTHEADSLANPGSFYTVSAENPEDFCQDLDFQDGPVPTNGVNGLTNEVLLVILIHRTKALDSKFPCPENKRAISDMENALVNFEVRTARRMARGVEGKNAF